MTDKTALVPLAEALPTLAAERWAKVREWDADRMRLQDGFDEADGEYLMKIRDALKPVRGMWTAYLKARGLPEATAYERIRRAEGRYVRAPHRETMAAIASPPAPPARKPRGSAFDPEDAIDDASEADYKQATWGPDHLMTVDQPRTAALKRMEQFIKAATLVATMHASSDDAVAWAEEYDQNETAHAVDLLESAATRLARFVQAVRETHKETSKIRRIK